MNRYTGEQISEALHLRQSINDITTTPLGSRVCRREYGNPGIDLIDDRTNGAVIMQLVSRTLSAIMRWEPRVEVQKVVPLIITNGILLVINVRVKASGIVLTTLAAV